MHLPRSTPDRFAVSGDLVGSRRTASRAALHRTLGPLLRRLGRQYAEDLVAPPAMTRGIDEMSAVFRRPGRIFGFVVDLNTAVWPDRFRFGLGGGTIDVAGTTRNAGAMDGPAFHRAADALRRAHAEGLVLAVDVPGSDQLMARALEAMADAYHALLERWTPRVARAVILYRASRLQTRVAKELHVSQQAVSKLLRRGNSETLDRIERAAADLLAHRMEPE